MNNTPMKLITQLSSWYYMKFCNCPKYYKYVVIKIKINYGKQWQDFFVFQKCLHTDSILKQRHDILKPNYHNDIQVPAKAPQLHHTGHHSQASFS